MNRFVFGCISIASLWIYSCSRSEHIEASTAHRKTVTVPVAKASFEDLTRELTLSAEFRPYQEVDVHAKVAGYVKEILVDVGDRVKKGQLLATLEIPEMAFDVEQASASAKRSEAEVARAREDLQRLESAHQAAHLSYDRLASVIKARPNLVAQQEIDDALARDRVSEAQISGAKAALAGAEQQVNVSRAGEGKVRTVLDYSRITAPISGVVTKRFVDTGEMVQAGTASFTQANPVVRLSQNDRLRLVLPIPESVVSRVGVGTPVEIRVQSLERIVRGRVSRFTGSVSSGTRTMETEVDVPNPDLKLMPGMFAEARLTLDRKPSALAVPLQAIADRNGHKVVLVVNDGNQIDERPVKLGLETANKVEILSGLKAGEKVVVGSRGLLKAGQSVEPKLIELAKGDQ